MSVIMRYISMKKLYQLTMNWITKKDSQGLTHEEAHRQVDIVADYLDFV